jgi:hypothetical protein
MAYRCYDQAEIIFDRFIAALQYHLFTEIDSEDKFLELQDYLNDNT